MKDERPCLVILTPGFPKDKEDSTCLPSQQNFIKAINRNFPAVRIIIISFQYPFTRSAYNWKGNNVFAFGGSNKGKLYRLVLWRKVWQQLKKIKRDNNIIGLLSFWCGDCALIANRFAKRYGHSHYCWILGRDAQKDNKYVKRSQIKGANLLALSDFIQDEFAKNHAIRPAHVIPLGIDINEFKDPSQKKDIDVLAAGSLIPLKQFEVFIAVIAMLQKDFPAIKAVLCGDGAEMNNLQALIEKLSLQENILLTGEKSHAELLTIMQRSKIFLHPSSYEGFGVVCLEALYAGTPVISFCRPMHSAIQNWHIVTTKEAMTEKTKELLLQPSAIEKILPYTIDDTARSVMQLFGIEFIAKPV